MQDALIYIFLATSTILFLALLMAVKKRKALERELSLSSKPINADDQIQLLKEAALKEIEQLKSLEKERLDNELREKRLQNDAEIIQKQQNLTSLLEEYKKSQTEAITLSINAERSAALEAFALEKTTMQEQILELQGHLILEQAKVEQLRRNQLEITEALMREAVLKDDYHLTFSELDRIEVADLQMVAFKYPRIRPIILKATYDIYYAPEVKKLIARVVGRDKISGIYRITSRKDGRVYVGKAVDIASRWQTHFKRAAGVETETTNLLYPAMREDGLDQFSFEILEKVEDETLLRDREKYWQEFYDAKSHGFSVR